MPPKKTTPSKTTGAKGAAAKPKAGATKTGTTKAGGAAAKKPAEAKGAEAAKPAPAPLPSYVEINLKQINVVLVKDEGGKIKASGKWALVVDPSDRVSTLLRYGNTNYLNVLQPRDMEPDIIRIGLLGALRYGKPLVIDLMEGDMYGTIVQLFDRVREGLLAQILDKSIMQEEKYIGLLKDSDGAEYSQEKFYAEVDNFSFIILTNNTKPNEDLLRLVYPIKVAE